MDFYNIKEREAAGKKAIVEVYPDFRVVRSKDLMVRSKSFYAVWDEKKNLWSTDEYDVQRLVDEDLSAYEVRVQAFEIHRKYLGNFSTNSWLQFRNYASHISDSYVELDTKLTFSNTEVTKEDYVSKRLPYPLEQGSVEAYDELMGVLYSPEERAKLEWAIGAVVAGDAKDIQKFIVLYGAAGTGKSTVLNIIMWLFTGYYSVFEAKALAGNNNQFATEAFKNNPLVAIQHDGDLSKIEDNTKLNSIISHEDMVINEKNKPTYMAKIMAFLFMGTNKPVHITDAKSGILRRLLDVHPTGEKVSPRKYQTLMSQIKFELGAIAYYCLERYREMGKDFYNTYRPVEMMLQTDVFYNYIEAHFDIFKEQDGTTLKQAYDLYKVFVEDTNVPYKLPQYKFREELRNYFGNFEDRAELPDGTRVRSWYSEFTADRFKVQQVKEEMAFSLVLDHDESLFDKEYAHHPAQYSKTDGTPQKYWTNEERIDDKGKPFTPKPSQVVSTTLEEIDTSKEHYVKVPLNHIVIDFDHRGEDGEKSAEKNLEAASQWPPTYAEFSKGGGGIHLHYNYDGDVDTLSRSFEPGVEVKVFTGNSSLRRRLTKCNTVPVATLNSGLPLKEKKVISQETIKSEKALRDLINRNINKEIHPGTKPSMDFIHKILEDAYFTGLKYDVSDMRQKLLAFAANSTNHALYCIKRIQDLKLQSENTDEIKVANPGTSESLVFFDVEVFPNLFVICWKARGDKQVVRMINPTPQAVEELLMLKLLGFNCRRYDNHMLYAAMMGYSNEQLYRHSKKIIDGSRQAFFGEAYSISYADIHDYLSKKQTLKKWEIELGIHHDELGYDWDEPVPEHLWERVADYCANDVIATEAVFEARKEDFIARQILSELSGLSINSPTAAHTSKIVFGDDRRPQEKFVYTDLSQMFPGYSFDAGKSVYKGEEPGEGGYVYAEPGMYENVAVLDVASMHPTSIETLNLFGEYTKNFSDLKSARIAIKRRDYESAGTMLGGKLKPFLVGGDDSDGDDTAEALSYALKIVINTVYGLTAASFDNSFRDSRNIDNIVAKRGALFMIDLKEMVQKAGFQVIHIKTDSIKIPNATPEIIDRVMEFGQQYGYEFEHEATYEKFCLVNDAVYIAYVKAGRKPAHWEAVGAQFQVPYVFKTLFSHDQITFDDLCETKSVTTALYLDYEDEDTPLALESGTKKQFVGKVGRFVPILPGRGGGALLREKDGKFSAATGSKGHRWLEAEFVQTMDKKDDIDYSYFQKQVDEAVSAIGKYGDLEWFVAA